ncbi:porin [Aurantivibrio plasticivorans]
MKSTKWLVSLAGVLICSSNIAFADFTWNGFLTVGGGIADPDEGETLEGYEDTFTFQEDSVLGLQASSELSDKVTATVQVLAKGSREFEPEISWANISYNVNDDLMVRVGRYQMPLYLYSDYLKVSYAYHWISPPSDVYVDVASSQNGINVVYDKSFSFADVTAEFYYGSDDADLSGTGGTDLVTEWRKQWGLVGTMAFDWVTVRLSYNPVHLTVDGYGNVPLPAPLNNIDGLRAVLNSLPVGLVGTGASQVADDLAYEDDKLIYGSAALKLEPGNFLFVTEFTDLDYKSGPGADGNTWYVSGGYRFGDWMVHLTHSESDQDAADLSSKIPLIPTVTDGLIAAVDGVTGFYEIEKETDSLGVRWNFSPGVAFKAEYADTEVTDNPSRSGKVLRFAIDAVF